MAESIVQDKSCGVERYWFLVRGRGFRPDGAPAAGAGSDATLVMRDGECVVVSVDATAMGWPEGTLLFRFRSEMTPCTACVDRAVEIARRQTGGRLTPDDVREMLRFAVTRCAAATSDPEHARALTETAATAGQGDGTAAPCRAAPIADRRHGGELWLIL
jgi:hypothetical protein